MQDSYRPYISSPCILKLSLKTRKLGSSVLIPNMQSNTRFISQSKLSTRLCKKMLSGKCNWRHPLHLSFQFNNKAPWKSASTNWGARPIQSTQSSLHDDLQWFYILERSSGLRESYYGYRYQ